ncbi:MAG: T9SS type A sorting domain-containing protein, partial [Bacteroidales bacterium]|nr:T9SS type A sorting domain-containing protein [Bacteroidales bacterium]
VDASLAGSVHGENLGMPSLSFPKVVVAAHGSYALGNNYPNPFSESTVIRFELPVAASIRLSVFNLMGEEVKVLAQGEWNAGNHTAIIHGEELAPGTYLYRLVAEGEAGSFVQTRKMIVTR